MSSRRRFVGYSSPRRTVAGHGDDALNSAAPTLRGTRRP
uniref:Uncharacterized protein n=1 Tax=Arundo donax TaxID=35708 RepID=A0A0A9BKJ5_ARUDO